MRSDELTDALLFFYADSQLVSVKNPRISHEIGDDVLEYYQSYEILTGPSRGKKLNKYTRPLSNEPVYRPGVVLGSVTSGTSLGRGSAPLTPRSSALRVFLCHASEDKVRVRSLYQELKGEGFAPWLDEEDIQPGQQWDAEIAKAIRGSDVVLVCLSQRSEKRGYIQKEIVRPLDVADEQPEGRIFLYLCAWKTA